jgi:hypothetical protein
MIAQRLTGVDLMTRDPNVHFDQVLPLMWRGD